MRIKKITCVFATTIFVSTLSSSVASHPKDLKYSSLSIVTRSEGNKFIAGISKPLLEKKYLYLQLDITTKEDVLASAVDEDYLIKIESSFCDKPNLNVLIDSGSLYWKGEDINIKANEFRESLGEQGEKSLSKVAKDLFTYTVFLGINSPAHKSWKKNPDGSYKNEYEAYDLVEQAEDICVAIVGRTMVEGFKSNVVKVEKSVIKEQLKKLKAR